MGNLIAVTNFKGGVGKTTTALNLGAALSAAGKRVLLVDNDPQGNLTAALGYTPPEQKHTLANLLLAAIDYPEDLDIHIGRAILHSETGVDLIGANRRLADAAARLQIMQMSQYNAVGDAECSCETVMATLLLPLRSAYDYSNGYFTTDSAGTILIEGIDPGTTLVAKETIAKEGYLLDDTPQTAEIKAGQTVTLEFRNQPKGSLVINKLDSVTHKPLEGVEFEITYSDGSYVDAGNGSLSSKGLYHTDKNGQIMLSGITGTVVVTETKTIEGYTIDEETRTQTVVINPNDTQTLTFYNTPSGSFQLIKEDEDSGKRIGNCTFEIRRLNDALVGTYTTGSNGTFTVDLEEGSYYAVEVKANSKYRLDDTPHYFEVADGETTTLRVTNERLSGILLHKIDSTTGEGIYGVKFLLYDKNKNPIGEFTTDDDGYIYITADDLPDGANTSGRFYLRELEAAEGYELDVEYKTVYVKPGRTAEIEWENTPVTGQIQVYKYAAEYNTVTGTPAGTPLQGAVYEISNARTGEVVDYITTDARGVAASKPLPLTRYKLVEVTAPAYRIWYSGNSYPRHRQETRAILL